MHVVQNSHAREQMKHWSMTDKALISFKMVNSLCLSCPNASLALQRGGFVPRKLLAAKSLLAIDMRYVNNGKEFGDFRPLHRSCQLG